MATPTQVKIDKLLRVREIRREKRKYKTIG